MSRPRDTAENREQWPEVFIWSCCDEDGAAEGWKTGERAIGDTNETVA